MERLFMDICMDLWAGDIPISYDLFKKEVETRIHNLKSHMGAEAHARLKALGIEDLTGMTIEEQDTQTQKQIDELQQLLDYLADDSNWTI